MPNTMYVITAQQAPTVARETIIDGYITPDDCAALYEKWKSEWPAPIEFPGAVKGISCEAILEVPAGQFNRTLGKARGERIRKEAEVNV